MAYELGNNIKLNLFGESHGDFIGATISGFCSGVKIDYDLINKNLNERKPSGIGETSRVEKDEYKIISGEFEGVTTGAPLTVIIPNENKRSNDYEKTKNLMRPSHADFTANVKYHNHNDYRGGGHFSGRLTTALVVIGSICQMALEKYNIDISTHIKQIGKVVDRDFDFADLEKIKKDVELIKQKDFKVLNDIDIYMKKEIEKAAFSNDSVGGILQTAILNLPVGLGEPTFTSVESEISRAMFSIGAVKGIEFGLGFKFAESYGSNVNDEFEIKNIDGNKKVVTKTNNNGGINGGITNSMPVVFNVVIKPTASISQKQNTIDIEKIENSSIEILGRHDPCIVRRANVVVKTLTAFVIFDLISIRYGNDFYNKFEKL